MKVRTIVGAALIALVLVAGVWALVARSRTPVAERPAERAPGQPLVSLHESVIQHGGAGTSGWRLLVDRMDISGGGRTIAASGLREGLIYDARGRPVLRISAGRATYNTARKDFEVTGGVKVVSHEGSIITTERIKWLPDKQILRCPSAVTLRAEGLTITADALDLHVPEETVTSTAQVRMRTPHGRLTGRNLTYNLKTGDYTMDGIQAVFTVEQAREDLERLR
ncbi:MAG: LPS export ABC transporter periplasmic protein LptC [Armatimonadetes bacterium]|nr:LPS export ABC transporter periplasmic protein LptC [Armatimonadota bacterium]